MNDYLYSGDTVLRILKKYSKDLEADAIETENEIDLVHVDFLNQLTDLLEHNDFLTAQSHKFRDFYLYMVQEYPYLAFTFKGRIKSLIRAENKFNGNIVEYVTEYYEQNGAFPPIEEVKHRLAYFRDLIAYRIVISMPRCQLEKEEDRHVVELQYLYDIANALPKFLEVHGFTLISANGVRASLSPRMDPEVIPYYRDYVCGSSPYGYRSLHITVFDNDANCYVEVQLRTKEMDDVAEIGTANHLGYQNRQEQERASRENIPVGVCTYFDEAYERGLLLQQLELAKIDVNMFAAASNTLVNDGCGLFRGRQILPYEHLSRFQSDI